MLPETDLLESLDDLSLAQRIFLLRGTEAPRRVVFCSADERTDSAEICVRAARALAYQVNGTVCLVDADVRSPMLHTVLGQSNDPGYVESVADSTPIKTYMSRVERDRLWVLPAGSRSPDDGNSVEWTRVLSRVKELSRSFRYVLVNTPAVNPLADFSTDERLTFAVREAFLATNGMGCWLEPVGPDLQAIIVAVQRVLVASTKKSVGTVLFSKLDPNADSCLACIRAGQMLAVGSTGRTCIVDADFSHPSFHERFSLTSQAGMLDLFRAASPANNYLRPSGPQNLWFLSAGMVSREGPATLEWDRVNVLLADLGARFDHVVIRGPALESGSESVVLGGFTDGLVLIVEQSQTRRRSTEEIVRQIRQSRVGVCAAVLIKTGSRVSHFQVAPRFPHDRLSHTNELEDSNGSPVRSH